MLIGTARGLKPVSGYGNRGHIRFVFTRPLAEDDAAAMQIGLSFVAGLPVEVSMEDDGLGLRVYAEGDNEEALLEAGEWFAQAKWNR